MLGDGIVSNVWDLEEAFRNDPFVVSFRAGSFDFSLILAHTRWTNDDEGSRANEVAMLGEHILWMSGFLPERDFVLAGDFNYDADDDHMTAMAVDTDLRRLDPNEASTFEQNYSGYASAYDHIYVPEETAEREWVEGSSGVLDATKVVFGDTTKSYMKKAKRQLSDHLPVWVEFRRDLEDDD